MSCHRCYGLLVEDHCYDLLDQVLSVTTFRCISCGNIIDPVIVANRRRQQARSAAVQYKEPSVALLVA
jgi:hypothetical protein